MSGGEDLTEVVTVIYIRFAVRLCEVALSELSNAQLIDLNIVLFSFCKFGCW